MNNEGMPNNFNNSNMGMENGSMNSNPLQNQAATDLMGGQGGVINSNVMQGNNVTGGVGNAFQGFSDVNNTPSIMQGSGVVSVPDGSAMPGQGNSGINAYTMQSEPVVQDNNTAFQSNEMPSPNLGPQSVNPNPIQPQNNMDAFDRINAEVINGNPMQDNSLQQNSAPQLNSNLIVGDAGGTGSVMMGDDMQTQNNFNADPALNNFDNMSQSVGIDNNVMMGNTMTQPTFNGNVNSDFSSPMNQFNSIDGNAASGPVQDSNAMFNSFNDANNNQVGGVSPMNGGFDNNVPNNANFAGGNQVVPNGMAQDQYGYTYEPDKKKFPLSTREIVLILVALIGLLVVLDMYVFHIVIKI